METLTKERLKEFCLLWGFDVLDEEHNQMPSSLYDMMLEDAEKKYGKVFRTLMSRITDTLDGFTYIVCESWDMVWAHWESQY